MAPCSAEWLRTAATRNPVTLGCSLSRSTGIRSVDRGSPQSSCPATVTAFRKYSHPVQPLASAAASSIRRSNCSSALSDEAIARLWRRHCSANPGRRVSGTQICTGRNPAMRRASLCFCTRALTIDIFMNNLVVALGVILR